MLHMPLTVHQSEGAAIRYFLRSVGGPTISFKRASDEELSQPVASSTHYIHLSPQKSTEKGVDKQSGACPLRHLAAVSRAAASVLTIGMDAAPSWRVCVAKTSRRVPAG